MGRGEGDEVQLEEKMCERVEVLDLLVVCFSFSELAVAA